MNLYIGNLNLNVSEAQLKNLFGTFGNVLSVKVIMDRLSGQSRGYGFIEMEKREDGIAAMHELNNLNFMSQFLEVFEVMPRK